MQVLLLIANLIVMSYAAPAPQAPVPPVNSYPPWLPAGYSAVATPPAGVPAGYPYASAYPAGYPSTTASATSSCYQACASVASAAPTAYTPCLTNCAAAYGPYSGTPYLVRTAAIKGASLAIAQTPGSSPVAPDSTPAGPPVAPDSTPVGPPVASGRDTK
ncbi:hypothetical protein SeMB42_g06660 [Synchytrium endobioticum]|uniref:Uncharacterized protein n=1 Tax=Synchytrium endobioticum TaxID=286115 RepID=A0A507CH33_9FUNG|nr:hypothetical protein SeMB42_g06660 [Synchytrium endobioticum]TPX49624.1 hypothetical protein SeLEV6574_g01349 [Synchytrium endobioticum]